MIARYHRPIAGRQNELKYALDHYEAAKLGHVSVMLVAGEPGIGKTRLLEEIATCALQDGDAVLRGHASEAEGMSPYQPFLEALDQYIQMGSSLPQEATSELQKLLVSLIGGFPLFQSLSSEASHSRQYEGRFHLYEAICKFLEAISSVSSLVLILDNLHWADTASLDLLCHIARRLSHAHLLIIGAYRTSEFERNPVLLRTVAELTRQRVLTTVLVNPLSAREIEMLARAYCKFPLSSTVSLILYKQCEGNPFIAEELLSYWIDTDMLVLEKNEWRALPQIK